MLVPVVSSLAVGAEKMWCKRANSGDLAEFWTQLNRKFLKLAGTKLNTTSKKEQSVSRMFVRNLLVLHFAGVGRRGALVNAEVENPDTFAFAFAPR